MMISMCTCARTEGNCRLTSTHRTRKLECSSIFSGSKEVKIVSNRKKLTVFFSDIVDFTTTTDDLESEELTALLNHYLTEMSVIALTHGATIDKYIGDAILAFFGDPETRGVKEDALACVKMAVAMQKRVGELAVDWRNAGIETPLRCRIGIHTGFCTVGNFGSEDFFLKAWGHLQ